MRISRFKIVPPFKCKCDDLGIDAYVVSKQLKKTKASIVKHLHFTGPVRLLPDTPLKPVIDGCADLINTKQFDSLGKALSKVCPKTRDYIVTESMKLVAEMGPFYPGSETDKARWALDKFFADNLKDQNYANEKFVKSVLGNEWDSSLFVAQEYLSFNACRVALDLDLGNKESYWGFLENLLVDFPGAVQDFDDTVFVYVRDIIELSEDNRMRGRFQEQIDQGSIDDDLDKAFKDFDKQSLDELLKDGDKFKLIFFILRVDIPQENCDREKILKSLDYLYEKGLLNNLSINNINNGYLLLKLIDRDKWFRPGSTGLNIDEYAQLLSTRLANFILKSNILFKAKDRSLINFCKGLRMLYQGYSSSPLFQDILFLRMALIKGLDCDKYGNEGKNDSIISCLLYGASEGLFDHDEKFSQKLFSIINELLGNEKLKKQLCDGDWHNLAKLLTKPNAYSTLNSIHDYRNLYNLVFENKPELLMSAFVLSKDNKAQETGLSLAKTRNVGNVEELREICAKKVTNLEFAFKGLLDFQPDDFMQYLE